MAETADKFSSSTVLASSAIKTGTICQTLICVILCVSVQVSQCLCMCVSLSVCLSVPLCVWLYVLLTFTATSHKVLVESTEARVYCVVALCQTVELAHQTLVNNVPQMNALQTRHQSHRHSSAACIDSSLSSINHLHVTMYHSHSVSFCSTNHLL